MSEKKKPRKANIRVRTVYSSTQNRTLRRPELTNNSSCLKTTAWVVMPKPIPVYQHLMPPIGTPIPVEKCEGRYLLFFIAEVEDRKEGGRKKIIIREGEAYEVDAPEVGE